MGDVRLAKASVTTTSQVGVRLAKVQVAVSTAGYVRLAGVSVTSPKIGYIRLAGVQAYVPPPASVTVTANAGVDQDAEPWSTITLDGAGSTGATSYAWAQTGGPQVTLAGAGATRTFVPVLSAGGGTLTFQLTATAANGSTATDTVVVSVLPVTEFARVGGVWVPRRPLKRSGGTWV